MKRPLRKQAVVAASLMMAVAFGANMFGPATAQTAAPVAKSKAKAKATAKAAAPATPLDLNKATAEEMQEALPGVGEVTARKIVAGRPYSSVDDLAKAGVPARTIAEIRPLVTVAAPAMTKPKAAAPRTKSAAAAVAKPVALVDLNTATAEELETLPGIGPAFAREIIAARPLKTVDDLDRVKGMSQARIDALRNHVDVTQPDTVATPAAGVATPSPATKAMTKAKAATKPVTAAPAPAVVEPVAKTKAKAATRPAAVGVVNLNTATREQLDALPGIGPVKAGAILEYRQATPFRTKEDVMKVKGIKEGEFAKIKDLITVE